MGTSANRQFLLGLPFRFNMVFLLKIRFIRLALRDKRRNNTVSKTLFGELESMLDRLLHPPKASHFFELNLGVFVSVSSRNQLLSSERILLYDDSMRISQQVIRNSFFFSVNSVLYQLSHGFHPVQGDNGWHGHEFFESGALTVGHPNRTRSRLDRVKFTTSFCSGVTLTIFAAL